MAVFEKMLKYIISAIWHFNKIWHSNASWPSRVQILANVKVSNILKIQNGTRPPFQKPLIIILPDKITNII